MGVKWDGFPTEHIQIQQNDAVRDCSNLLASGDGTAS